MKKLSRKNLRSILMLTLTIILLAGILGGCNSKEDTDETINNLPNVSTGPSETAAPTDEPTESQTEPPINVIYGTVTTDNLNIRSSPGTDSTAIRQLAADTRVEITETKTIDGVNWGRIEEGWINLNYVLLDGQTPTEPTDPTEPATPDETTPVATEPVKDDEKPVASGKTGTITASELNIREGAGSSYDSIGKYKKGDEVTIIETKNGWGRTSKGWISMNYVKLDSGSSNTDDDDKKDTSELVTDGKTKVLGYGIVEDISSLNVRTGPGTDYDKVGSVSAGQRLAYYQKSGSWVRINKGWVSTKYFDIGEKVESGTTGTVNTAELNIREGAGSKYDAVGKYKKGDKITILEVKNNWGKTDKGWVSLNYVILGDSKDDDDDKPTTSAKIESDGKTKVLGYGVVTTGALNLRTGPSSEKDDIGTLEKGDRVAYYQKDGKWVRTKDGWVSSSYLYIEGTKGTGAGSGTATGEKLNVRTGPGTGYKSVGKLSKGDKVEILAQLDMGKMTWGYTKDGWVSMDYIKMAK